MKKHKRKKIVRCIMSGRMVDNKEVVLTEHAIDFVKKLGYDVVPAKLISLTMMFFFLFLTPILAQSYGWDNNEIPQLENEQIVTSVTSSNNCILVNPNNDDVVLTFNQSCATGNGTIVNLDNVAFTNKSNFFELGQTINGSLTFNEANQGILTMGGCVFSFFSFPSLCNAFNVTSLSYEWYTLSGTSLSINGLSGLVTTMALNVLGDLNVSDDLNVVDNVNIGNGLNVVGFSNFSQINATNIKALGNITALTFRGTNVITSRLDVMQISSFNGNATFNQHALVNNKDSALCASGGCLLNNTYFNNDGYTKLFMGSVLSSNGATAGSRADLFIDVDGSLFLLAGFRNAPASRSADFPFMFVVGNGSNYTFVDKSIGTGSISITSLRVIAL